MTVNESGVRREFYRRLPPVTPPDGAALAGLFRHARLGAMLAVAQATEGPCV